MRAPGAAVSGESILWLISYVFRLNCVVLFIRRFSLFRFRVLFCAGWMLMKLRCKYFPWFPFIYITKTTSLPFHGTSRYESPRLACETIHWFLIISRNSHKSAELESSSGVDYQTYALFKVAPSINFHLNRDKFSEDVITKWFLDASSVSRRLLKIDSINLLLRRLNWLSLNQSMKVFFNKNSEHHGSVVLYTIVRFGSPTTQVALKFLHKTLSPSKNKDKKNWSIQKA